MVYTGVGHLFLIHTKVVLYAADITPSFITMRRKGRTPATEEEEPGLSRARGCQSQFAQPDEGEEKTDRQMKGNPPHVFILSCALCKMISRARKKI